MVDAYQEYYAGYQADPADILGRTFSETNGYDEMVVLRDIRFESHCEHHMAPIIGTAHIAYRSWNRNHRPGWYHRRRTPPS